MRYESIKRILEQHGFFGFTAQRNKERTRLRYTFRSIAYFMVEFHVDVIRLEPEKFGSEKIVGRIDYNGNEIKDAKELAYILKNIYKIHRQLR